MVFFLTIYFIFDIGIRKLFKRWFSDYVKISIRYSWKNFQNKICFPQKDAPTISVLLFLFALSNTLELDWFWGCLQCKLLVKPASSCSIWVDNPFSVKNFPHNSHLNFFVKQFLHLFSTFLYKLFLSKFFPHSIQRDII